MGLKIFQFINGNIFLKLKQKNSTGDTCKFYFKVPLRGLGFFFKEISSILPTTLTLNLNEYCGHLTSIAWNNIHNCTQISFHFNWTQLNFVHHNQVAFCSCSCCCCCCLWWFEWILLCCWYWFSATPFTIRESGCPEMENVSERFRLFMHRLSAALSFLLLISFISIWLCNYTQILIHT